jgi:hypothetical protein
MAKAETKDHNSRKRETQPLLDQALLDEFFSTIAGVVIRLTKTGVRDKNANNPTKREASKP